MATPRGGRAETRQPPSLTYVDNLLDTYWCHSDAFWMTLVFVFPASVFRLFTHQTRHLVLSFNMENDQRIKAHLLRWFPAILYKYMIFGLAFLASVFRPFTYQTRHLVSSFNMENDQRIKAHLLRWFPAIFEKIQFFGFSVLDSWHSIFQSK